VGPATGAARRLRAGRLRSGRAAARARTVAVALRPPDRGARHCPLRLVAAGADCILFPQTVQTADSSDCRLFRLQTGMYGEDGLGQPYELGVAAGGRGHGGPARRRGSSGRHARRPLINVFAKVVS
jgi:hypothetical protein